MEQLNKKRQWRWTHGKKTGICGTKLKKDELQVVGLAQWIIVLQPTSSGERILILSSSTNGWSAWDLNSSNLRLKSMDWKHLFEFTHSFLIELGYFRNFSQLCYLTSNQDSISRCENQAQVSWTLCVHFFNRSCCKLSSVVLKHRELQQKNRFKSFFRKIFTVPKMSNYIPLRIFTHCKTLWTILTKCQIIFPIDKNIAVSSTFDSQWEARSVLKAKHVNQTLSFYCFETPPSPVWPFHYLATGLVWFTLEEWVIVQLTYLTENTYW